MSRIGFITRHPKRSLSALGTVLAASALVAGSGAFFTTSHSNQGNTFQAGTLSFTNQNDGGENGGKIFAVDHMRPDGPSISQTATITNTGDVPADFYLSAADIDNNTFLSALRLVVRDQADHVVYDGTPNGLSNTSVGHISDGDSEQYEFTVSLPDTNTDQSALMGAHGGLSFNWKAVSTSNP